MTETNALTLPTNTSLTLADDKDFNDLTQSSSFLSRLQFMVSQSPLVQSEEMKANTYYIIKGKNSYVELGATCDVIPIYMRFKAIRYGDNDVLAYYDIKSEAFQQIRYEFENVPNSGCSCGPEFLVYVPAESAFCTLHFGNKSCLGQAPNLKKRIITDENGNIEQTLPATLKSGLGENKKGQKWRYMTVEPCSAIFDPPDQEALEKALKMFMNPPVQNVEKATEEESTDREL